MAAPRGTPYPTAAPSCTICGVAILEHRECCLLHQDSSSEARRSALEFLRRWVSPEKFSGARSYCCTTCISTVEKAQRSLQVFNDSVGELRSKILPGSGAFGFLCVPLIPAQHMIVQKPVATATTVTESCSTESEEVSNKRRRGLSEMGEGQSAEMGGLKKACTVVHLTANAPVRLSEFNAGAHSPDPIKKTDTGTEKDVPATQHDGTDSSTCNSSADDSPAPASVNVEAESTAVEGGDSTVAKDITETSTAPQTGTASTQTPNQKKEESDALTLRVPCDQEDVKPPYSYIALIAMAISHSPSGMLTLGEISDYIIDQFPYYRKRWPSWRNQLRHNLSLNDCFVKVPRGFGSPGRGNFWKLHPGSSEMFRNGSLLRRKYRFLHQFPQKTFAAAV